MQRKNLFSLDLSKKDSLYECQQFKLRGISAALQKESDELTEEMKRKTSKEINSALFLPMIRSFMPIIAVFLFVLGAYFFSISATAPSIVTIVLGFVGILVTIFKKPKEKEKEKSEEEKDFERRSENLQKAIKSYLSVPENAPEIDILTYLYGSEYISEEYANDPTTVFLEDGKLCFFCDDSIYGIPTEKIDDIALVIRETTFAFWEKEEPYDSEAYAEYKMTQDENEVIHLGAYYSVRFSDGGEDYEIVIPPYDIEKIIEITGVRGSFETPLVLENGLAIGVKREKEIKE